MSKAHGTFHELSTGANNNHMGGRSDLPQCNVVFCSIGFTPSVLEIAGTHLSPALVAEFYVMLDLLVDPLLQYTNIMVQ